MHSTQTRVTTGWKRPLAALAVVLASCLAIGPTVAQTRPGRATASPDAPAVIFQNYCSVCHGEKGDGMSLARFALDPQPRDFTSEKSRKELSRAHMIETLNKGSRTKQGSPTAMVGWKCQLSPRHIEAVVDYIIVRFMEGKAARSDQVQPEGLAHQGHDHSTANVKSADYPYGLVPNAVRGKSIYAANCASCHGSKGDGRGKPAQIGAKGPRNFRAADFREFASGFSLFSAISQGAGHLSAWDKALQNQDIADVSEYVLQAFVKQRRSVAAAK